MISARTPVALIAFLALALLAAGCGGGTDVDFTKASETIRASLESSAEGFGTKVENVDCPKDVKVEAGTSFECTVRYPGGEVAYALVKIRDAEADLSLESLSAHPPLR